MIRPGLVPDGMSGGVHFLSRVEQRRATTYWMAAGQRTVKLAAVLFHLLINGVAALAPVTNAQWTR